jgi:hypothetical protein
LGVSGVVEELLVSQAGFRSLEFVRSVIMRAVAEVGRYRAEP